MFFCICVYSCRYHLWEIKTPIVPQSQNITLPEMTILTIIILAKHCSKWYIANISVNPHNKHMR